MTAHEWEAGAPAREGRVQRCRLCGLFCLQLRADDRGLRRRYLVTGRRHAEMDPRGMSPCPETCEESQALWVQES